MQNLFLFIIFICLQTRKGNDSSQFAAEILPLPYLVLRMTIDLSPTSDLLILYESRRECVLTAQWHQTLSNLVFDFDFLRKCMVFLLHS